MHIQIPFLVLLLAVVAPTDANLFARGSDSLRRVHHHAAKRSANFARDLRTTFGSIFVEQNQIGSARVYCVSSPSNNETSLTNGNGNGTSPSSSTATFAPTPSATGSQSNGTSSARPSAPSSGAPSSSTSTASSPWKVVQSFVSLHRPFIIGWHVLTPQSYCSKETRSSQDGISSLAVTPRMAK